MNKKVTKILIGVTGFVVLFGAVSAVLRGKSIDGIFDYTRKIDGFYAEPENTLDVVCIGSSNGFCNIGAMELWENYGIPTYYFGNGNQTPEESLFYLQEVYKTQSPSVIMLEMHRFTQITAHESINPYFEWNIGGIPWSAEKIKYMEKLPDSERWMGYFDIGVFHSRWKELESVDFTYPFMANRERNIYKGSTVVFAEGGRSNVEGLSPIEEVRFDIRDGSVMSDENRICLEEFITYAQLHGSKIVLFYAPLPEDYNLDIEDDVRKTAEKYGVELWAYADPADYGLDYEKDYMDNGHMNLRGQEKFAAIIGKRLVDTFGLANKRENVDWAYYEEDYLKYMSEIQANQQN